MDFYEKQLGSVSVDGKKLKRGFTTGTAAAAAAKGAFILLTTGEAPDIVDVKLFSGQNLTVIIENCGFIDNYTSFCSVKKYAGDDIDATNEVIIIAKVEQINDKIIEITGGIGIGVVTRAGLQISPGNPAINPKPQELIKLQFDELSLAKGIKIEISAPDGEFISRKTFNPRLGIQGGISILGTTGIVEPMSEDAFKRSLLEELKQKKSNNLCFTFGNMGEKNLIQKGINENSICICSNFIGFMLREAVSLGIKNILVSGHIGKMVKLSGGIFNTHSHIADAKNEIIASNLALLGAPLNLIKQTMQSLTAEECIEYINNFGYAKVFNVLAEKAATRSTDYVYKEIQVHTMMFDLKGNLICKSQGADRFIEEILK